MKVSAWRTATCRYRASSPRHRFHPCRVQPIAFCIDDRGRLWVAEGYAYPRRKGAPPSPIAADGKPNKEQLADIFGKRCRG
jgi:hypothetical protein